jgi:hypothetical protein
LPKDFLLHKPFKELRKTLEFPQRKHKQQQQCILAAAVAQRLVVAVALPLAVAVDKHTVQPK